MIKKNINLIYLLFSYKLKLTFYIFIHLSINYDFFRQLLSVEILISNIFFSNRKKKIKNLV